ncbi:hypothetical protein [Vulcanisaeta souniana]|uniref:Uncharacterized protein n=1 Tax=Vulcanisaeta souniana JCM 11219 TaxID=1293586 RepID=A0A830EJX6_9CREN|nr:hypothetical protein [Vulcanisaeta souniana]BDR92719.1 hypothetical protein Vsou_18120 [Vulcanisaeta souniana JCM 11219]GGI84199.1 hypothetical protein GCM10007112_21390 [Vulcanisaeta souniana JCM 11219]
MKVKHPITLVYLVLGLAVVAIPLDWWTYNFGGLLIIGTSPFQFTVTLLGTTLEISGLITAILEAYRAYLIIILARNIYLVTVKGTPIRTYTLISLSIPYLIYPIIIYYIANYVFGLYHVPARYPLVLMGSGVMTMNYGGTNILMTITITPHLIYWVALAVGLMAMPAAMEVRKHGKPRQTSIEPMVHSQAMFI